LAADVLLPKIEAASQQRVLRLNVEAAVDLPGRVMFAPPAGERRGQSRYFDPYSGELLGEPARADAVRTLLSVRDDGSYALDMRPFRFSHDSKRLCAPELAQRLGPPRPAGAPLRAAPPDTADADLAASVHQVVEEALLALARELARRVPSRNLCLAGDVCGVAAHAARLLRDGPFEQLYMAPAPGDAGGALGAALAAHHALADASDAAAPAGDGRGERGERGGRGGRSACPGVFLGEAVLEEPQPGARLLAGEAQILQALLDGLLAGGIVGWVRGRFEWGPRSLGHRSLLADPRAADAAARVNAAVTRREALRPFGCVVAAERAAELFELPSGAEQPLRLGQLSVPARDTLARAAPAVVHVDGSTLPQLVSHADDPLLHALLVRFGEATGVPVLLSAPLCLRGDPPVRGEQEARTLMQRSALPLLVVEDRLYSGA
jgi:carbamoyltransferase